MSGGVWVRAIGVTERALEWRRASRGHALPAALGAVLTLGLLLPGTAAADPEAAAASDRIIVQFKSPLPRNAQAGVIHGWRLRRIHDLAAAQAEVLALPPNHSVDSALAELRATGAVEFAEPDFWLRADRTPNDPEFDRLWAHHNSGALEGAAEDADIDSPVAWDATTGDRRIVVALIDTGMDLHHEDLVGNLWTNPGEVANGIDDDGNGWVDDLHGIDARAGDGNPMDTSGHGTHVAGVLGAVANNGVGIAGLVWNVQMMTLNFLDGAGNGRTSDALRCIDYVIEMRTRHGVDIRVLNASFGGGEYSQALQAAIRSASDAGILVVAAAGNDAVDTDQLGHYPASYDAPNVIAVAATGSDDRLASFSNFGAESVDLAAPGDEIFSTLPGSRYGLWSGTSMAVPLVSGAAALVWSLDSDADPVGVKNLLMHTVEPVAALAGKVRTAGRLDLANVMARCAEGANNVWVISPRHFTAYVGLPVEVAAAVQECATRIPQAVAFANPGNGDEAFELRDDGTGVYRGLWLPEQPGPLTLSVEAFASGRRTVAHTSGRVHRIPRYALEEDRFDWIEASEAESLDIDGDDEAVALDIGFRFPFYGIDRTEIWVSSNGYLTFGGDGEAYENGPIPGDGNPQGLIAAYWDDLRPDASTVVTAWRGGEPPARHLTVTWQDVPYWRGEGRVWFQSTLYEDGSIRLQYRDVEGGTADRAGGASATVGIEHPTHSTGLLYSHDEPMLTDRSALLLRPLAECEDGVDNDGDGNADHPDDPSCRSPRDRLEGEPPLCRLLGFELVACVPFVGWLVRSSRDRGR